MSGKVQVQPDRPDRERRSVVLPDWMRDPPPPRLTVGRRLGGALAGLPGATRMRHRWWAWQERRRLHERFPVGFKIVAFFASWLLALGMVLGVYAIYSLI